MNEKIIASELFRNKKQAYAASVAKFFEEDRLSDADEFKKMEKQKQELINQKRNSKEEKVMVIIILVVVFEK